MKPKPTVLSPQGELFRVELVSLIDMAHPLVKLASRIDWRVFDEQLSKTFENPYDGHTLQQQMEQLERLCIKKPVQKTVHVDMGYRGHNYGGEHVVIVDRRRRGDIPKRIWRWMTDKS